MQVEERHVMAAVRSVSVKLRFMFVLLGFPCLLSPCELHRVEAVLIVNWHKFIHFL